MTTSVRAEACVQRHEAAARAAHRLEDRPAALRVVDLGVLGQVLQHLPGARCPGPGFDAARVIALTAGSPPRA